MSQRAARGALAKSGKMTKDMDDEDEDMNKTKKGMGDEDADGDDEDEDADKDEDEEQPGDTKKAVPGEKKMTAGGAQQHTENAPRIGNARGPGVASVPSSGTKKSRDLTGDDLEKSLAMLRDIADSSPTSRKDVLLSKALDSDLSKSEKTELMGLLGGESRQASLGEEVTKSMDNNNTLQEALDVSGYLEEQHREMCKSLSVLSDHIEQSDNRQQEFNLVLAKAVASVGTIVKSMGERMGAIEAQPARAPKSQGVQALSKSFAGQAPAEAQLSKSVILDTLEEMLHKSAGGKSSNGEDLYRASVKYETSNSISQALLDEVQRYRAGAR